MRVLVALGAFIGTLGAGEWALRRLEPAVGGLEAGAAAAGTGSERRLHLRSLMMAVTDPWLVYRMRPGLEGTFRGVSLRTNSLGLRDGEPADPSSSSGRRVIVLGDSVAFGWGVEATNRYSDRLERELSEACGHAVDVINAGVPGYNTAQQVRWLESHGLKLQPDAVVIEIVHNDLKLPHFLMPTRSWHPSEWVLTEYLQRVAGGSVRGRLQRHGSMPPAQRRRARRAYAHLAGEGPFEAALEKLASLGAEHGFEATVALDAATGVPFELARAVAERSGTPVVDLGREVTEELVRLGASADSKGLRKHIWLSASDRHPNALGHELYARALFPGLANSLCPRVSAEEQPP